MALEVLKDIKEIDGFQIKRIVWEQPKENYIEINDKSNAITFNLQKGAIKENGVNGCQIDTIIKTAKIIVEKLNEKFPCKENKLCLAHLSEAIKALANRKKDREKRGVEGESKL